MSVQAGLTPGQEARNIGINQAYDHANKVEPSWGDKAYLYLKKYISLSSNEFMTEDIRKSSEGILNEPPSKRAWGAVIVRAKREGIIEHNGYRSVSNKKAHATPASVWKPVRGQIKLFKNR